jgi:hypothetical protein
MGEAIDRSSSVQQSSPQQGGEEELTADVILSFLIDQVRSSLREEEFSGMSPDDVSGDTSLLKDIEGYDSEAAQGMFGAVEDNVKKRFNICLKVGAWSNEVWQAAAEELIEGNSLEQAAEAAMQEITRNTVKRSS